jgi:pilus assembly protein Flp/PilA
MKKLFHLFDSEEGVTSIEYALIASLIAMVIVVTVTALGSTVKDLYQSVVSAFP